MNSRWFLRWKRRRSTNAKSHLFILVSPAKILWGISSPYSRKWGRFSNSKRRWRTIQRTSPDTKSKFGSITTPWQVIKMHISKTRLAWSPRWPTAISLSGRWRASRGRSWPMTPRTWRESSQSISAACHLFSKERSFYRKDTTTSVTQSIPDVSSGRIWALRGAQKS